MKELKTFDRGMFTISLDLELAWGTVDVIGPEKWSELYRREREVVIGRLLDLFIEFDVSATWCILGHLFLDKCAPESGRKHPEIVRAHHAWHPEDWFTNDPCSTVEAAPIFYGRDLVKQIRDCRVAQEIGSHSFSHVIFGDAGCSAEAARSELKECVRLAEEMGIEMSSFVFPRNEIGHLGLLSEFGFTCYRGTEPNWFENMSYPHQVRRAMRLLDVLRAAAPPVVLPERDEKGLWNIPGSAMYFPAHGLRRHISIGRRTKRAIKGLDAAAAQKKIFHLWFHPTNMADEPDRMFAGLREILEHADSLRQKGELDIRPMKALIS